MPASPLITLALVSERYLLPLFFLYFAWGEAAAVHALLESHSASPSAGPGQAPAHADPLGSRGIAASAGSRARSAPNGLARRRRPPGRELLFFRLETWTVFSPRCSTRSLVPAAVASASCLPRALPGPSQRGPGSLGRRPTGPLLRRTGVGARGRGQRSVSLRPPPDLPQLRAEHGRAARHPRLAAGPRARHGPLRPDRLPCAPGGAAPGRAQRGATATTRRRPAFSCRGSGLRAR